MPDASVVRGQIGLVYWIVVIGIAVLLIAAYIWVYFYARKRQRAFDEQYSALKERKDVFVLNKKMVKERPKSGWMKYMRIKTYQVVGRLTVSQQMRGMQMSKMQTVTFQTSKEEYQKIQPNHKYKMDIAGNYIGLVLAPPSDKSNSTLTGKILSRLPFRKKSQQAPAAGSKAKSKSDTKSSKRGR